MIYRCPSCYGHLRSHADGLACDICSVRYPVSHGIVDFSGGKYYDSFVPGQPISERDLAGLANEVSGAQERIRFYQRLLSNADSSIRLLDSGCGNGVSVDLLCADGVDAWGIDLSSLRKWQWESHAYASHLSCASGFRTPFADSAFDVILCSGVLEHIGVTESAVPTYTVEAEQDLKAKRTSFLAEHLRILRPGGSLYLDFPNGACPLDFWHSTRAGIPRWHSPREQFLPTVSSLREYLEPIPKPLEMQVVSPHGRLAFRQVGRHRWGRALAPAARRYLQALAHPALRLLLSTGFNPFLVVRIRRTETLT